MKLKSVTFDHEVPRPGGGLTGSATTSHYTEEQYDIQYNHQLQLVSVTRGGQTLLIPTVRVNQMEPGATKAEAVKKA